MIKNTLKGDTPLGRRLQKKADKKRDDEEIQAYLALDLKGLTKYQKRLKFLELAEDHGED